MKILGTLRLGLVFSVLVLLGCSGPDATHGRFSDLTADAVFYNGVVYTLNDSMPVVQGFAVSKGKILVMGSNEDVQGIRASRHVDLNGKAVYPGFYDAHCHFYGYAIDRRKIWLTGTASFDDILDTLVLHRERLFMGWLFGRGWDQNDWVDKDYPDRRQLDSLFPDVPVFLLRIDGHAALVNSKAMSICGITADTRIEGGKVEVVNGRATGLLIDNAVDLVKKRIPSPGRQLETEALLEAQQLCFAVGLTSLVDAGLDPSTIDLIDSLQKAGALKMRMNIMVSYSPRNLELYRSKGRYRTDRLHVCSFKLYADGALGSRGACLLHDYADLPGHKGFLLSSPDSLKSVARRVREMGFQLNTHCIGDSANSLLLSLYAGALKGKNDLRWRIEHAQCLAPDDFSIFRDYSIIPSVQPVHATSDMYWAGERLGKDRLKTAYAYKRLLEQNGVIAGGSDFPVEDINPLYGFYAAVARKDQKGYPEGGFQKADALTREEALKAMTVWAAYASFEEKERGSLSPGKDADFVVLEDDLMKAPEKDLFRIQVQQTWIAGERVYPAK